jgi:hypothetical protein
MGSDPVSLHVAGEDAMCLAAYVRLPLHFCTCTVNSVQGISGVTE